jgi:hypothetical protein
MEEAQDAADDEAFAQGRPVDPSNRPPVYASDPITRKVYCWSHFAQVRPGRASLAARSLYEDHSAPSDMEFSSNPLMAPLVSGLGMGNPLAQVAEDEYPDAMESNVGVGVLSGTSHPAPPPPSAWPERRMSGTPPPPPPGGSPPDGGLISIGEPLDDEDIMEQMYNSHSRTRSYAQGAFPLRNSK